MLWKSWDPRDLFSDLKHDKFESKDDKLKSKHDNGNQNTTTEIKRRQTRNETRQRKIKTRQRKSKHDKFESKHDKLENPMNNDKRSSSSDLTFNSPSCNMAKNKKKLRPGKGAIAEVLTRFIKPEQPLPWLMGTGISQYLLLGTTTDILIGILQHLPQKKKIP